MTVSIREVVIFPLKQTNYYRGPLPILSLYSMDTISKNELEKLINKPRAFRDADMGENMPIRRTMILLGSDTPSTYETPRHYKKLRENRKHKNNESIF
jgi:hypothetical protein